MRGELIFTGVQLSKSIQLLQEAMDFFHSSGPRQVPQETASWWEMKDYQYIYSAIKLQVVYLNAITAGLLAGLLSYLLKKTHIPTHKPKHKHKHKHQP